MQTVASMIPPPMKRVTARSRARRTTSLEPTMSAEAPIKDSSVKAGMLIGTVETKHLASREAAFTYPQRATGIRINSR